MLENQVYRIIHRVLLTERKICRGSRYGFRAELEFQANIFMEFKEFTYARTYLISSYFLSNLPLHLLADGSVYLEHRFFLHRSCEYISVIGAKVLSVIQILTEIAVDLKIPFFVSTPRGLI